LLKIDNPFHNALSLTLLGMLFVVPGLLGCKLRKSPWTFVGCTWSDSVWWKEVWVGLAVLLLAGYFWKRAIRSIR
jgi:hypothetical protein